MTTTSTQSLTITIPEAAGLLGISRALAYEAAGRGEIPSVRIGRRLVVPRWAIDELLYGGRCPTASAPPTEETNDDHGDL